MGDDNTQAASHAGTYVTYFQLSGDRVPLDQFLRELGILRRSDVMAWAATFLQVSSEMYGQSVERQKELIDLSLEGKLKEEALKVLELPGRNVVYFRRQLWLLLQFASMVCGESGLSLDANRSAFGKLALIASDLLHEIEMVQVSNDIADKETMEWKVTLMVSVGEVMPDIHSISRAYAFWFTSVEDPSLVKKLEKAGIKEPLKDAFLRQTGIPLYDCFFALFTLHKYLSDRAKVRPISPIILTETDPWWGSVPVPQRKLMLRLLALHTTDFPVHLFGASRQSWATDFTSLMARPLIEVKEGEFLCPEIGFLRAFFLEGIFWLLAKAFPEKVWKVAFGDIYEWYITQVFIASMPAKPAAERKYYDRVKFEGKNIEACDGLIMADTHAFLCEFKGKRLTNRQKSGVSVQDTITGIKGSIASDDVGIGQIVKNIKRILDGESVVSGNTKLDIASKQVLVPVLVWHEEAGCNVVTRAYLDNLLVEMLKKAKVDENRVGQVLLLSTYDVEAFQQCCTYEKPDVLLKKFADYVIENPTDVKTTFMRFAIHVFNRREKPKGYIGESYDRLMIAMKEEHKRLKYLSEGDPK